MRVDSRAKDAFRAAVRYAPPPFTRVPSSADVLEVRGLGRAIAQADRALRSRGEPMKTLVSPTPESVRDALPIVVLDPDAFNYPAGRIPGFSDIPAIDLPERVGAMPRPVVWAVFAVAAAVSLLAIFSLGMSAGRAHASVGESAVTHRH